MDQSEGPVELELHRNAAERRLQEMARRADRYRTRPSDKDKAVLLTTIILSAPTCTFETQAELATDMWDKSGLKSWSRHFVKGGEVRKERHSVSSVVSVLKGNSAPPNGEWGPMFDVLTKRAAEALGLPGRAHELFEELGKPRATFHGCLEAAFAFAGYRALRLKPLRDAVLLTEPAFEKTPSAPTAAEPRECAAKALNLLKGEGTRIVYVQGPPFSSKRDVLKTVVRKLPGGILETRAGRRLATFAQALGAIDDETLVGNAFRFFASETPAVAELSKNLDIDGKISFIRAAAKATPVLAVFADIEDVDENAVLRRLRGGRVGDVVEAIVEGHRASRLLIGIHSKDGHVPWEGTDTKVLDLRVSSYEFHNAVDMVARPLGLGSLANESLSGVAMRLIVHLLKFPREPADLLKHRREIMDAARAKEHADERIFRVFWDHFGGWEDVILLGLIASSEDGLELKTLVKIVSALRLMKRDPDKARQTEALEKLDCSLEWLNNWRTSNDALVWRRQGNQDGPTTEEGQPRPSDTFYMREPVRRVVLARWMQSEPDLARDGMWCIAREAAHQARQQLADHGPAAADLALARNLQALHCLMASIDQSAMRPYSEMDAIPLHTLEAHVLPDLALKRSERPTAILAYRYSWNQLYRLDIEGDRHELLTTYNDPLTRLEALLPFLQPGEPWIPSAGRRLRLNDDTDPEPATALGPARVALTPSEQVDLLTRLATGALRAGRFDLVLDSVWVGERVAAEHADKIDLSQMLRLLRAEVDVGVLFGALPAATVQGFHPQPSRLDGIDEDLRFELRGLADYLERLISRLAAAAKPQTKMALFVEGKLRSRLAEVRQMCCDRVSAREQIDKVISLANGFASTPPGPFRAPITGGRGIRRHIRMVLDEDVKDELIDSVFDDDGLIWPIPRPVISQDTIRQAEELLDLNRRRAARGRLADNLGIYIDEGRIALAQGELELAAARLKHAEDTVGRGGAAFDTLLELNALQARLTIERAMALSVGLWKKSRPLQPLLQDIEDRIGAAERRLKAFDRFDGFDRLVPYASLRTLLEGMLEVLRSRALPPGKARRGSLERAKTILRDALNLMEIIDFGVYLVRTKAMLKAVEDVLRRPMKTC